MPHIDLDTNWPAKKKDLDTNLLHAPLSPSLLMLFCFTTHPFTLSGEWNLGHHTSIYSHARDPIQQIGVDVGNSRLGIERHQKNGSGSSDVKKRTHDMSLPHETDTSRPNKKKKNEIAIRCLRVPRWAHHRRLTLSATSCAFLNCAGPLIAGGSTTANPPLRHLHLHQLAELAYVPSSPTLTRPRRRQRLCHRRTNLLDLSFWEFAQIC